MIYAAVGARATPGEYLSVLFDVCAVRGRRGWVLRSGGAPGADTWAERGARSVGGVTEIFRPEHCTQAAYELAAKFCSGWEYLGEGHRLRLGRNCMIVLGADLLTPVSEVVCWSPGGRLVGGTGHTIRVAEAHGIPVDNLGAVPAAPSQQSFDF